MNEQPLSVQTTKARELTARGVRRMFCLVTKREKLLEWSRETDGWSASPVEEIADACFIRPLPSAALLKAALADGAVIRALRDKGHPEIESVREEGREEGREEALRIGILDLCESLDVPVPADAAARLAAMNGVELDAVRLSVKRNKRWPLD